MDEEEGSNPFNMRCLVPIQRIMLNILKQNPPIFVCIMQDRTHPGKINGRVSVLQSIGTFKLLLLA